MPPIRPFCGVRYSPEKVVDLSLVVTQPYDRIPAWLQDAYYDRHPRSMVRLVLGRSTPDDGPSDSVYTRARSSYRQWRSEGTLVADPQPALYVYRQTFSTPDGQRQTRQAFLAAVELSSFEEETILPHERTLSAPKIDRLNLFRETGVAFEPVFLLYPDPDNGVDALLAATIADQPPAVAARELYEHDVLQELWVVTAPDVIQAVASALAPMQHLIIADGHHRYETSLAYRDEMRLIHPDAPATAPFNFVMAALVSMSDPGLVILPTNRLVHSTGVPAAELSRRAAAHFAITEVSSRQQLRAILPAAGPGSFGFVTARDQQLWTLTDPGIMNRLAAGHAPQWRALDVSILHQLVLEHLLGLSKESIAAEQNLRYLREAEAGFAALDRGEGEYLFLLNPTRIDQVRSCAAVGEKMPQKSTDFYPKMISGLVIYPLHE